MRSRAPPGEPPQPSYYQARAEYLLLGSGFDAIATGDLTAAIELLLPETLRRGWRIIQAAAPGARAQRRRDNREMEELADTAVAWLVRHGASIGVVVPDVGERARMFGVEAFHGALRACGLSAAGLYNAQGNLYDYEAVLVRAAPGIAAWLHGDMCPEACAYPHPRQVAACYTALRDALPAELRGGVATSPFPGGQDLAWLLHDDLGGLPVQAPS